MKKKYESRVRGRMLNLKLLGEECSAPPWLALLQKRWQLNKSTFSSASVWLCLILSFVLVILPVALFSDVYVGRISMLMGVVITSLIFLVWICAYCVSRVQACFLDDVHCYLARIKDYHKPHADIEFSNGRVEKRLFVYTADGKTVKPGDEVYVCVIGNKILQFCEVRPARKLGKVPNRKPEKKEKSLKKEEAACQINRKSTCISMKRKYKSRTSGKMLDLKQLGKECSVPPGLALIEKRQQIYKSDLDGKIAWLILLLRFALPSYMVELSCAILISTYADNVSTLLNGLLVIVLLSLLLLLYAIRVFKRRNCIQTGDVRCYIARVKNYHKPYADIEFSNGHIEKQLFVYTADGRSVSSSDEVYVCVIEHEDFKGLQFCEVRLVSELGKVSSQKPQRRKKSEKKKKPHAR